MNHAAQFNWALTQLEADTEWVLRIDADEIISLELANQIKEKLCNVDPSINGIYWGRRISFQGRIIRYGGVFPVKVLRLFRFNFGRCEKRWMDEHIKVAGPTINIDGEMIDKNLNSMTWWIEKHNKYSSLEALELLNLTYHFMPIDHASELMDWQQVSIKRWIKDNLYARLPCGFRALVYFLYRYIFRCGFLDGREGAAFHFLQGFWYRYLVDIKIDEVKKHSVKNKVSIIEAIQDILEIKINLN